MRLFSTIILLSFSFSTFAAPPNDCYSADLLAAASASPIPPVAAINCTSLTIDTPVIFPSNQTAASVEFIVSGNVAINADIIMNGSDGTTLSLEASSINAAGGPGADEGGGLGSGAGESGYDITNGFNASNGQSPIPDGVCENGGSGGGWTFSPGESGPGCSLGTAAVVPGGNSEPFPASIRGGFGGGAGGAYLVASGSPSIYDLGGGGGGGGGLRIESTGGTITIKNGVTISARGGRGGNAINMGGGGGGGSGGIIWLESPFPVVNQGIVDVRGGEGGINTKASSPRGANGGGGGDGLFRTVEAGLATDSGGLSNYSVTKPSLKSDISCGTIIKEKNNSLFYQQMLIGFVLSILVTGLLKILSQIPRIASKKIAFRN